jgi:hypothetical protein
MNKKEINKHAGKTFNGNVLIEEVRRSKNGEKPYYKALCYCGNYFESTVDKIKSGRKISCGCRPNKKIGVENDPLLNVWRSMKDRCTRPKCYAFKDYGGRGINVDPVWLNFESFKEWCLNNGYKPGLQLDRIDNNGGYSSNNCRFVTRIENNSNKRNNKFVVLDGEAITCSEASRRLGKYSSYVSCLISQRRPNPYPNRLILYL